MSLETTSIRSMLGLRFRDAVSERPVTEGLHVTVDRKNGAGPSTTAVRTRSGAYVAQGLAGLRGYERSQESVPLGAVTYYVRVRDRQNRFLPVTLRVNLPYDSGAVPNGLYPIAETPTAADEESPEPTCYLFSSVKRPVGAGHMVVYADLVTKSSDGFEPLPFAVLEVRHIPTNGDSVYEDDPPRWFGVADAEGRVAVQFPTPRITLKELEGQVSENGSPDRGNGGQGRGRPSDSGNGPPNGDAGPDNGNTEDDSSESPGKPLSTRTWTLGIKVRSEPDVLEIPEQADRPFLPSIFQQSEARLYSDDSTLVDERESHLRFGEPLVLTTPGLQGNLSALRIAPVRPE